MFFKRLKIFIVILGITSSYSFAYIHVTKTVRDIARHFIPHTKKLIVFDLDLTLIKTPGTIGSDPWFYHTLQKNEAVYQCPHTALKETIRLYTTIHNHINLELVEHDAAEIIRELQALNDCYVIALTARSLPLIDRTLTELKRLGINFSQKAPSSEELTFYLQDHGMYRDGILFGGNNDKGTLLTTFLEQVGFIDTTTPLQVIALDDKIKYLHQQYTALKAYPHVSFVGLHFTLMEDFIKTFNIDTADGELKVLLTQIIG